MTPYEMEEQLKNLDARTMAIAQILPTLATKQDLRDEVAKLATKDELHLTTRALQHEMETGFQEAKNHAERLNEVTQEQLRILRGEMAGMRNDLRGEMAGMKDDLRGEMAGMRDDLRGEMAGMRDDLRGEMAGMRDDLRGEMAGMRDDLRGEMADLRGGIRAISTQITALAGPKRRKKR